jgi:hypothetical protein
MKKLLLLGLIVNLAFCEVYYKNKDTVKQKESDYISFTGVIFNIREYSEHTEVTIATKKHGRIRAKVNSNRYKEGQKVSGMCSDYNYGMYNRCGF